MKRTIVLCSILLLLVPFTAVAQVDFCEANFDYDLDVDGTDAFQFKTDFGRSMLKNPCPPDGPAPVPKTGQSSAYNSGDDGSWQAGVTWPDPRFIDNEDGTVIDKLTGLIWLQDANCFGTNSWDQAVLRCNELANGSCGLTDGSSAGEWRLPNLRELQSLISYDEFLPALFSNQFMNVQPANAYWSSTTNAETNAMAWYVSISDGRVNPVAKVNGAGIWPVRGGH